MRSFHKPTLTFILVATLLWLKALRRREEREVRR